MISEIMKLALYLAGYYIEEEEVDPKKVSREKIWGEENRSRKQSR